MSPEIEQRLKDLMRIFLQENTKLNLSALRTEDACWNGNILDSVFFTELIDQKIIQRPNSLIDVGTGGGFPLLPLAIMFPQAKLMGLDSTRKKIDAIGRIATAAQIDNLTLVAERAEVAGRDGKYRGRFDVATARAVAPISVLLEYLSPFVAVDGHIVLWKSMHIEQELAESARAQKALHCTLKAQHTYDLGGDWGTRQFLVFSKDKATPPLYPRAVGVPGNEPL